MLTIIGLGNPGKEYEKTRHNVGFLFVDYLQMKRELPALTMEKKHQAMIAKNRELTLLKPQTFMNNSGLAARSYLSFYNKSWQNELENLYVAHDDLDLAFGTFKIQFGKGPKVHNGLNSLYDHLSSQDFWHVRIGIDGREGQRVIPGKDYVLAPFSELELEQLDHIFDKIADQVGR